MTGPGRPDPLTAEERALAEALARTAPAGQVPVALETAVLEAARAEGAARAGDAMRSAAGAGAGAGAGSTAGSAAMGGMAGTGPTPLRSRAPSRRRPRSGWLRGGALAASLVVAAGVAWQLQPRFGAPDLAGPSEAHPAFESAPATTAGHGPAPSPDANRALEDAYSPPPAMPSTADESTAQPPAIARSAPAPSALEAGAAPPGAAERPVRSEAAESQADHGSPPPAPPPASPATATPPARPAPPAPPRAQPATAAHGSILAEPQSAGRPAAEERARTIDPRRRRAQAFDGPELPMDQPDDDTPPASFASPSVRDAWLARIRDLLAAGRHDEARESFAEFRRRHPDTPVPDDLRGLLDE